MTTRPDKAGKFSVKQQGPKFPEDGSVEDKVEWFEHQAQLKEQQKHWDIEKAEHKKLQKYKYEQAVTKRNATDDLVSAKINYKFSNQQALHEEMRKKFALASEQQKSKLVLPDGNSQHNISQHIYEQEQNNLPPAALDKQKSIVNEPVSLENDINSSKNNGLTMEL